MAETHVSHPLSRPRPDSCSLNCPGIPMAYVEGVLDGGDVLLCGPHVAYWEANVREGQVRRFRFDKEGNPVRR